MKIASHIDKFRRLDALKQLARLAFPMLKGTS